MKTLKINIPEGFEIDKFDLSTGEVTFKPVKKEIDVFSLKTWEDVLDYIPIDDPDYEDLIDLQTLFTDNHHLINYQKAIIICKVLNQGWVPDWSNPDEHKYFPWFKMEGSSGFRFHDYDSWITRSHVGSRLACKSADIGNHIGEHFSDIWEKFMTIS